jgi:sec-independent protein translocase protein TatA
MINSIFLLFNIGGSELFLIVLVVIMFFGADKIPELARGLGKGIRTVRNATNDIKREITESAETNDDLKEVKETFEEGKKKLSEIAGSIKRNTEI